MKHFIVIIKYIVPIEKIDKYLAEHRDYLTKGYELKILLASGPQNPRTGGILIAKANSVQELDKFCENDPFYSNSCATYEYLEFQPVKFQEDFRGWFES